MQTADFAEEKDRLSITTSGLWRMNADHVALIDRSYVGPATVLVPNEDILVVVTGLPFASRRQREAAAPFAVEGLIGQPLSEVHVAIGRQVGSQGYLCAIVGKAKMTRWVSVLQQQGLDHAILLPDALNLPVPPKGHWCVCIEGSRARIRSEDASGFAMAVDHLPMAWEAAGRPAILSSGEALPPKLAEALVEPFDRPLPAQARSRRSWGRQASSPLPPVDLRQGRFAARQGATPVQVRSLAMILGIGLSAHLAIFAADTWVLKLKADRAEARVEAQLAQMEVQDQGGSVLGEEPARALPKMGGTDGPFLDRMGRLSQGVRGQDVSVRSIGYTHGEPLILSLNVPDASALERVVGSLERHGLATSAELSSPPEGSSAGSGLNGALRIDVAGGAR